MSGGHLAQRVVTPAAAAAVIVVAVEGAVVDPLGFEEHDRIVVLDRADQQSLGVVGTGGDHGFQAADMGEYALGALGMGLSATDAAATGRAYRDRGEVFAAAAMAQPCQLADDLVDGRIDVIGELHLDHGTQAVDAHADGRGDDAAFGDRCVEGAVGAVFVIQALGAAEYAAEKTHVLPHHQHRGVGCHRAVQRRVDRLHHAHGHPLGTGLFRCRAGTTGRWSGGRTHVSSSSCCRWRSR